MSLDFGSSSSLSARRLDGSKFLSMQTVLHNPCQEKVASTAVGLNPQWTMQSRQLAFPLHGPYCDQSVVSSSSWKVANEVPGTNSRALPPADVVGRVTPRGAVEVDTTLKELQKKRRFILIAGPLAVDQRLAEKVPHLFAPSKDACSSGAFT